MGGYAVATGNRLSSGGGATFTYDNEGNRTAQTETASGKVTTYSYDFRNRMTGATQKNSGGSVIMRATYTYDALDRRVGTQVDADGAGAGSPVQTWTVYDGMNTYADFDGSGNLKYRYIYGPAVDQILERISAAGTKAWYLTDGSGTVRDIANVSGSVIDHIAYDSFGNVASESSPTDGDRFKYTGREYDSETKLQFNRARYYDAAIGRWTQEDPIGFGGGDANLYRYVGNGPTNATDPTGLEGFLAGGRPYVYPSSLIPSWSVFTNTLDSYMQSLAVTFAGGYGSSASGIVSGAGTWGTAGLAAGGLPGAALGVEVGALGGGGFGFVAGAWGALTNSPRDTTIAQAYGTGVDLGWQVGAVGPFMMPSMSGLSTRQLSYPAADAPRPAIRTNSQLVQDIATRADRWGTRNGLPLTGSKSGIKKHKYAEDLLDRYQNIFGDLGLTTEARYDKATGMPWQRGTSTDNTIRLDVVEGPLTNPTAVFDYKFGKARLTPSRITEIQTGAGLGPNVPIIEVKP